MNVFEWLLLLIVVVPLVILGLDKLLENIKSPSLISNRFESVDGYVTRKTYSPKRKHDIDPEVIVDLEVIHLGFNKIDHAYRVEIIIDQEKLIFNDEKLFKSVKIGNIVDLQLSHKRFIKKTILKQKNIFRTELDDFKIRA